MPEGGGVWDANELALTAVLTVIMQLSCFLIAFACQFDKITDLAGSSNFIINAVLTLVLNGTYFTRQVITSSSALPQKGHFGILNMTYEAVRNTQ